LVKIIALPQRNPASILGIGGQSNFGNSSQSWTIDVFTTVAKS